MSFAAQVMLGMSIALAFLALDVTVARLVHGNRAKRRAYDRGYRDGYHAAASEQDQD